jgi:hypothetical protein
MTVIQMPIRIAASRDWTSCSAGSTAFGTRPLLSSLKCLPVAGWNGHSSIGI